MDPRKAKKSVNFQENGDRVKNFSSEKEIPTNIAIEEEKSTHSPSKLTQGAISDDASSHNMSDRDNGHNPGSGSMARGSANRGSALYDSEQLGS